jgi:hypothetical protein
VNPCASPVPTGQEGGTSSTGRFDTSPINAGGGAELAQTFTVAKSGMMTGVGLALSACHVTSSNSCSNGASNDGVLEVELVSTQSGLPDERQILASGSVNGSQIPDQQYPPQTRITFSRAVPVVQGTMYSIVILPPTTTSTWFTLSGITGDTRDGSYLERSGQAPWSLVNYGYALDYSLYIQ